MKLTKKTYLIGFVVVVLLLACVRWVFPEVAASQDRTASPDSTASRAGSASVPDRSSFPRGKHPIHSVASLEMGTELTEAVQKD